MNNKLPYQGMADQVASRGRYGDTTLMHVNPAEVQGLASLTQLTINPDTGYPEAFLPLLAPFLGTALGTALGGAAGATGLGLTAAGAAGSGLATGLATGSVEQGLMAGLTGFALGGALQGPSTPDVSSAFTTPDAALTAQNSFISNASPAVQASTDAAQAQLFADSLAKEGVKLGTTAGTGTISDLGTSAGLKTFGKELIKPQNLLPFGTGLGGQAVQMDYEDFEKSNQAGIEARAKRKQDLRDNYVVKQPGMQGSVFNSNNAPGNRTNAPGMNANQNPYNKFAREGGQVGYADGGQVERMNLGGITGIGGGYFDANGNYVFPNSVGSTTIGGTTEKTVEDLAPTKTNMPDKRLFSQGYDPSSIDMATGLRKTDEQLEGMVRGRGLTPVPHNYMAGFMPEYQYVSNIQPTSTIGGADSSNGVTIGGSNSMGLPNVTYGTGQNVYKGSYDPELFAGGTPYNEYLLGNEGEGLPDYLSSYMQNTPYYKYQDQNLSSIWGGGGYGTPGYTGEQPRMMPQQSNNDQIDALNKRIEDLMSQINPTPTEEVTEEGTEEGTEEKKKDKNTSARWERTEISTNDDGVTVITLTDMNPDSPTYGQPKTELDESTKTKTEAPITKTVEDFAEGSLEAYGGETGREERQASLDADSYLNSIASNPTAYGYTSFEDAQEKLAGKYGAGNIASGLKKEIYDNATFSYSGDNVSGVEISLGDNNIKDFLPYASGGQIKNSINTLDQYAQPLPMGNMSLNNISLGNMYAEGGMVQDDKVDALMQNPVIQEKMSEGDRGLLQQASFVLLGRIDDDGSIISEFVDKFGSDALDMLKGELLPDMQQQGMIEGQGGGMDDKVDGVIGDQERVAVSPGEYIVPADVVGDLGDGNSEQGARIMDDFLSRVRTEKHGTDQQPSPVNLNNVMPS